MEMLAAQAAHQTGPGLDDEDALLANEKLSEDEKRDMLQKTFHMAASNGDVERVTKLLGGNARPLIDINAPDEDGTPPLIYASCFVRASTPTTAARRRQYRLGKLTTAYRATRASSGL